MKRCPKCNEVKPMSKFHKNKTTKDGLNHWCKPCVLASNKLSYIKNIEKYKEWNRVNKEKNRVWAKTSYKRRKANGKIDEYLEKCNPENKQMRKAISRANKVLRKGGIKKMPCEVCGEAKVDMHHEDYSKPLDVTWLCRSHHKQVHVGLIPLPFVVEA